MNKLCLSAILPWLQQNFAAQAKPWTSTTALPSFWELVSGCAILLDGIRLILVPSEEIDSSELRVPQEWIDIPSWAGDYYLAVQVEPDEPYLRIWGYSTNNSKVITTTSQAIAHILLTVIKLLATLAL